MSAVVLDGPQAAFVDAARVARLATSMPDGSPHVVPVCPVLDLDRILIASALMLVAGLIGRFEVHRLDLDQREVALSFLRRTDLPGDGVARL